MIAALDGIIAVLPAPENPRFNHPRKAAMMGNTFLLPLSAQRIRQALARAVSRPGGSQRGWY
jgi:hypothetical protein